MDSSTTPRVAIVGGGLGGLLCARVLQLHGRPVTVFEGEPSPEARGQGGTLDMHPETGQVALRAAGLLEKFQALSRPEGQEWRLLDHVTGAVLSGEIPDGGDEERPEIDRGRLRGLLLGSLRPGTVHWGHSVGGVTPHPDGTCQVRFREGGSEHFDLVIGADGAWSRVRPGVSDAVPAYTGVTFVETGLDDVDTRHPALAGLTGEGTMMAKAPGRGLFVQRNSGGHIRVYAALRVPEDWYVAGRLDFADTEAVRADLLARYTGWDPALLGFLRGNDSGFVNRPLHALPAPHSWDHVPGVTLLGDAAHLMPPLGVGANLAMLDGAELAQALIAEPTVDDAVRAYESVMLPRAGELAKATAEGLGHLLPG
ncbi:FAD-dependent oxidoreductase [Amycolatopsis samaneae]|uniref:Flavin-dependent monooxygenase n=1 Tax=Amycolatopsis samaneae TaxID=664691 RepID=A0ABW5GQH8_9PSEU